MPTFGLFKMMVSDLTHCPAISRSLHQTKLLLLLELQTTWFLPRHLWHFGLGTMAPRLVASAYLHHWTLVREPSRDTAERFRMRPCLWVDVDGQPIHDMWTKVVLTVTKAISDHPASTEVCTDPTASNALVVMAHLLVPTRLNS